MVVMNRGRAIALLVVPLLAAFPALGGETYPTGVDAAGKAEQLSEDLKGAEAIYVAHGPAELARQTRGTGTTTATIAPSTMATSDACGRSMASTRPGSASSMASW